MNSTIEKFGYPTTLVKEYENWVITLRPVQITLGSLILACKENVESFSAISRDSHLELSHAIVDLEKTLKTLFEFQKINYLMLMMLDPHVHFHVIPRYASPRILQGITFEDLDWPGPPNVLRKRDIEENITATIRKTICENWKS